MCQIDNYYQKMNEIYAHLQDEESKELFEFRVTFLLDHDQNHYVDAVQKLYHDWIPSKELIDKMSETEPEGIIIFGCGCGGRSVKRMLEYWGLDTSYFCDNNKAGEVVDGIKVLSVENVVKNYRNYLVIVGSYEYADDMYQELLDKEFEDKCILRSESRLLTWGRGNQYFDVFEPEEGEVFIDAGSFNGETSMAFCKWTNGKYKKIYAFEPIKKSCELILNKNIPKIEILNCAVWNKKEVLYFVEDGSSSCMNMAEDNGMAVQGLDIDSVAEGEKVTFIKMDVEGNELEALKGAKQTIINYRPRLAICIYHKPMDVIEIPAYILSLVPDYKFYIRHYTSHIWETVLYAKI